MSGIKIELITFLEFLVLIRTTYEKPCTKLASQSYEQLFQTIFYNIQCV